MKRILIVTILAGLMSVYTQAQHEYRVGMLITSELSTSISKTWKASFFSEFRESFSSGVWGGSSTNAYEHIHRDFGALMHYKWSENASFAGGYMLRVKPSNLTHRAIQQYVLSRSYGTMGIGHRFRLDQTFDPFLSPEFRLRYRLTIKGLMTQQKTKKGAWYWEVHNEWVNAVQSGTYDLEIRIIPVLGLQWTKKQRLSLALDYRFDRFIPENPRSRFFGVLSWKAAF